MDRKVNEIMKENLEKHQISHDLRGKTIKNIMAVEENQKELKPFFLKRFNLKLVPYIASACVIGLIVFSGLNKENSKEIQESAKTNNSIMSSEVAQGKKQASDSTASSNSMAINDGAIDYDVEQSTGGQSQGSTDIGFPTNEDTQSIEISHNEKSFENVEIAEKELGIDIMEPGTTINSAKFSKVQAYFLGDDLSTVFINYGTENQDQYQFVQGYISDADAKVYVKEYEEALNYDGKKMYEKVTINNKNIYLFTADGVSFTGNYIYKNSNISVIGVEKQLTRDEVIELLK